MKPGQSAKDVWSSNAGITKEILSKSRLKRSAIVITLATPVDDITVLAQLLTGLPTNQVFGFGGDLDRNRLEYTLRDRRIGFPSIELIGEHGGNAIPVYRGEESYDEVARDVRGFLRKVTSQAGETRNLSTAILLASLVNSIITDSGRTHYLCGYHPEYQMYLTWGFKVGVMGTREPNVIELYDRARGDLRALLARRADVTEMIKADLSAP
jgi:malate/lactate dehydrogenase